jgi:peroxiredoxin
MTNVTRKQAAAAAHAAKQRRARRLRIALWGTTIGAVIIVVAAMMWSARSTTSDQTRTAPDFTLTDTNGTQVHLADYRGGPVVLYFSEGAGCQSCLLQMAAIEKQADAFRAEDITVLPIVMNTAAQIRADMATNKVTTPFLIDADGSVSRAYGTLGKGMHAGLPGHSFVLIDAKGTQKWYGEYPSMYLAPQELLGHVRTHL